MEPSVNQTFKQAHTFYVEGKIEEAERLYRIILKIQPEHLDANNNLGLLLSLSGRPDEAETILKKVIEFKPDFADAHFNLANALCQKARFKEAEVSYKKAIGFRPNYAQAYNNLGGTMFSLNKLNEGEDFSALALDYSDDGGTKEQGGNLGMLAKSQLPGALGDAVFAMSINEVSELVRTDFGFHIVQLNNIESDGQVPFETVRAELEMELKSQKSSVNFTVIERELSDALFDADGIEVIARDLNFDLNELKGFTRNGGGEFGANQIVIDALFNAQRNNDSQLSDIIEVDANRSIVFQVSMFNEATVMPLDQVRDQIISDMKFVSAEVLANNIATKISSLMENNEDLVPTVEELDSVTMRDVIINRLTEDVDFVIQANVFGMKKPLPGDTKVGTVVMQNSNYAVFSLKNHTYGIPEMIPQDERDAAKERLNQQSGVSDYTAFISELQLNAAIEKNEELLNAASMFD